METHRILQIIHSNFDFSSCLGVLSVMAIAFSLNAGRRSTRKSLYRLCALSIRTDAATLSNIAVSPGVNWPILESWIVTA